MKLNQIELTLVFICTTFKLIYEFDFGSYPALGVLAIVLLLAEMFSKNLQRTGKLCQY